MDKNGKGSLPIFVIGIERKITTCCARLYTGFEQVDSKDLGDTPKILCFLPMKYQVDNYLNL
jgi:hypothetical protein